MPARNRPPQPALAYSNRAVLDNVLLGKAAAEGDLAKAAAAAPEALLVGRNLEVINTQRTMREVRAQN